MSDVIIKKLKPSDFDGHTEFRKLTPEQRLRWLSEAVDFLYLAKKSKKSQK